MPLELTVEKDLVPLRLLAEAGIATAAKTARARYATPGKEAVYVEKRSEGLRWLENGQPDDLAGYPWIRHEVGSTAPTAWHLVQIWIGLDDFWARTKAPQIEGIEMRGKARLLAAASPAAINAVEAETLSELAAV
jgi:hypothetical protein